LDKNVITIFIDYYYRWKFGCFVNKI
jgi:hypothetical protein